MQGLKLSPINATEKCSIPSSFMSNSLEYGKYVKVARSLCMLKKYVEDNNYASFDTHASTAAKTFTLM